MLQRSQVQLIDKILEMQGDEFKQELVYYFLYDPVFMNKAIFNRDMPPHQRLEMRLMWFRPFYVGNDGYRAGKSTTATYVQMQQCILFSQWDEGILSHTLRGAEYLYRDHIKSNYDRNQVFRAFCSDKPRMGAEKRIDFKNHSSITAYPSDVLKGGLILESLSLTGATIDEATSFSDPSVLWDVMLNRVTKPPPSVAQRLGITNTVRILGAAKYTFQPIYKSVNGKGGLVHLVIRRMAEWGREHGNRPLDYVFMSANLREHLPPDEKCWICDTDNEDLGMFPDGKTYVRCKKCGYTRPAWRKFFASTLQRLDDAEMLMAKKLFNMRWMGKWQTTSDEIYSSSMINQMPRFDCNVELERPKQEIVK
jgi:hypothetical protein